MMVYRGEKSSKVCMGKPSEVQPCVVSGRDGMELGVAVIADGKRWFWGLVAPQPLITFWRAMKLLEELDEIENHDLCRSYYTAQRNPRPSEQHYLDELLPKLPKGARERVLNMAPPNIHEALVHLHARSVRVSMWEIKEEIGLGLIQPTPLIEQLIQEAEERRRAYMECLYGI